MYTCMCVCVCVCVCVIQVFNAERVAGADGDSAASAASASGVSSGWRDSLYRAYKSSSQHVRVAVYGSKHDPTAFEGLLKEFGDIRKHVRSHMHIWTGTGRLHSMFVYSRRVHVYSCVLVCIEIYCAQGCLSDVLIDTVSPEMCVCVCVCVCVYTCCILQGCLSDHLIDTVSLGAIPKVALVSTLTSVSPAQPYLFRTYELPPGADAAASQIAACGGTSRVSVWQAVRASASAPYYLDDFPLGEENRFQDGATTANNPAVIALQQVWA